MPPNGGGIARNGTYKKFLLVRQEGTHQVKRNNDHYKLDVIIDLEYRGYFRFQLFECALMIHNAESNRSYRT